MSWPISMNILLQGLWKIRKCFLNPIPLKLSGPQFSPTVPMASPVYPYSLSKYMKKQFSLLFPECPLESTIGTSSRLGLLPVPTWSGLTFQPLKSICCSRSSTFFPTFPTAKTNPSFFNHLALRENQGIWVPPPSCEFEMGGGRGNPVCVLS